MQLIVSAEKTISIQKIFHLINKFFLYMSKQMNWFEIAINFLFQYIKILQLSQLNNNYSVHIFTILKNILGNTTVTLKTNKI